MLLTSYTTSITLKLIFNYLLVLFWLILQIRNNSVIDFIPELIASGPSEPVVAISDDLLDPSYDYDFSNKTDDGTEYFRGEHPYYRPYGWKRIALKVAGKYEDDIWLGKGIFPTRQYDLQSCRKGISKLELYRT